MGMAASQARLLFLTARMHDIEYEAQAIQNAKIQLSTQSDEVYAAYNAALEDETLTLQTDNGKIAATFNTLCGVGATSSANGKRYVLINNYDDTVIVPDAVGKKYDEFMGSDISPKDRYTFALYALGVNIDNNEDLENIEQEAYNKSSAKQSSTSEVAEKYNRALELLKQLATNKPGCNPEEVIKDLTDRNQLVGYEMDFDADEKAEFEAAYNDYRKALYKSCKSDIYAAATEKDKEDFVKVQGDFDYYMSVFEQIQRKGGWTSISDYRDPLTNQNVDNNEEWLESMIKSGYITVAIAETDDKGKTTLNTTSPSSDSALGYTSTTTIDKAALAKAEAKYEHDMKQIDKKDKQYDLSLSKLETERNALKTEYDSVKKVIEDNVDRTFGIFS